MIRRALPMVAAAAVLLVGAAGCDTPTEDPTPAATSQSTEQTNALAFIEAKSEGDRQAMCDMQVEPPSDCSPMDAREVTDGPALGATYVNEQTGTTAVVVDTKYADAPNRPERYVMEIDASGKILNYEDISTVADSRESVAAALGWSQ